MAADKGISRTFRPVGARVVSATAGAVLVALIALLWTQLPPRVRADFSWIERGTLLVTFGLILVGLYAIFRTRAYADSAGLVVVNGYRRHRYEWAQIVAVSLTQHRPWAVLDLSDGSTVSVMAVQTADGARATRLTRDLAALVRRQSATDHND